MISSKEQLERTAVEYGLLPFFSNTIPGLSVEEMAAPGMLFGEASDDYGCWEWKGPVIQEQTTAYGKFFRGKAGFVSRKLLPDFLNYRRLAYPVKEGSLESEILKIIRKKEGMTSTQLKNEIFGMETKRKSAKTLVDFLDKTKSGRKSLESPLRRLQMGGWLLIADFEYKYNSKGDRYGWGVALYSTPEIWFDTVFNLQLRSPLESFEYLVSELSEKKPDVARTAIEKLLK